VRNLPKSKLSEQEKKVLQEGELLLQLKNSRGWQEGLKPLLEAKRDQSFPDPSKFKTEDKFLYAAKVASVFKKVVAEIIGYVEQGVPYTVERLRKKQKGELVEPDFGIGRPKKEVNK